MKPTDAPWDTERASRFLADFDAYRKVLHTVEKTLQQDVRQFPHEIRAAAAMVIMLCRKNLWPCREGQEKLDRIAHVAARQLTRIKQLFEQRGKIKPEILADPAYRTFLTTLDQEIRILESRMTDPKPQMPTDPPITWGEFWT
jgi:hypothetical protein